VCGLLLASGTLAAQCGEERTVSANALDEFTWKRLSAIYEDVGEGRYDEAFEDLQKLLERSGRDAYLKAVVNQALAQVEWSREHYTASLRYFDEAVALDVLPDEVHFALMYQIAQLYYLQDRLGEAGEKLDLWFCRVPAEKITAPAWVLKASIALRLGDHAAALAAIDSAIGMTPDPEEPWYQLKLAAHFELRQYGPAADTLEAMIERWPGKKRYWIQLAQILGTLERGEEALAVLALAHRVQLLDTEQDLALLSSLYSQSGLPFKAAEILQEGVERGAVAGTRLTWTRIADAWYAAEELERALAGYEAAGRAAQDGETDLRRAYILADLERWSAARDALDQALDKGGLHDRQQGEAYLLRGLAQFNLEQLDAAGEDWERAGRIEETRESARQWLNHLREERRRRAS
jgi:tetratricopeptide (TPR) repeat protein